MDRSNRLVFALNPNDVLCGRGVPVIINEGNVRFRELVRSRKEEYLSHWRHQIKHSIARKILEEVSRRQGRFLKAIESAEDKQQLGLPPDTKVWEIISEEDALEKIKQALRGKDTQRTTTVTTSSGMSNALQLQQPQQFQPHGVAGSTLGMAGAAPAAPIPPHLLGQAYNPMFMNHSTAATASTHMHQHVLTAETLRLHQQQQLPLPQLSMAAQLASVLRGAGPTAAGPLPAPATVAALLPLLGLSPVEAQAAAAALLRQQHSQRLHQPPMPSSNPLDLLAQLPAAAARNHSNSSVAQPIPSVEAALASLLPFLGQLPNTQAEAAAASAMPQQPPLAAPSPLDLLFANASHAPTAPQQAAALPAVTGNVASLLSNLSAAAARSPSDLQSIVAAHSNAGSGSTMPSQPIGNPLLNLSSFFNSSSLAAAVRPSVAAAAPGPATNNMAALLPLLALQQAAASTTSSTTAPPQPPPPQPSAAEAAAAASALNSIFHSLGQHGGGGGSSSSGLNSSSAAPPPPPPFAAPDSTAVTTATPPLESLLPILQLLRQQANNASTEQSARSVAPAVAAAPNVGLLERLLRDNTGSSTSLDINSALQSSFGRSPASSESSHFQQRQMQQQQQHHWNASSSSSGDNLPHHYLKADGAAAASSSTANATAVLAASVMAQASARTSAASSTSTNSNGGLPQNPPGIPTLSRPRLPPPPSAPMPSDGDSATAVWVAPQAEIAATTVATSGSSYIPTSSHRADGDGAGSNHRRHRAAAPDDIANDDDDANGKPRGSKRPRPNVSEHKSNI